MWFNPDELIKTKTSPLANPANPANPANYEPENSKTAPQISKLAGLASPLSSENIIVTCYTPNGNPIEVEATSAEHAAWLLKMNPKPKGIHP